MLTEPTIAIPASGLEHQTVDVIEEYIRRRAEQLARNEQATGAHPSPANWTRLDAAFPWKNSQPSCAPETTPSPRPLNDLAASTPPNSRHSSGCPLCDGAGFYKLAVPLGHPQFGELLPCACTLAERERREAATLDLLREQLQRYQECRLATFDVERQLRGALSWHGQTISVQQQRAALHEALHIATQYIERRRGWLYLYGPPGSGKTRLAASIANEFRDRQVRAIYGRVQALLDWLKVGFQDSAGCDFDQRLRTLERAPLLLIDDLGTEHGTSWERVVLENMLNERYNRELPTVLTSNAWRDELPARIADRIAELAQVVWLPVSSYRRTRLGIEHGGAASKQAYDPWDRGEDER